MFYKMPKKKTYKQIMKEIMKPKPKPPQTVVGGGKFKKVDKI